MELFYPNTEYWDIVKSLMSRQKTYEKKRYKPISCFSR